MKPCIPWAAQFCVFVLGLLLTACPDGDPGGPDLVSLNAAVGNYRVTVGNSIVLKADVSNAENPVMAWTDKDGNIVSETDSFIFQPDVYG